MNDSQYKDIALQDSIVTQSDISTVFALDKEEPFTFKRWIKQAGISNAIISDIKPIYEQYLAKWNSVKTKIDSEKNKNTIEIYTLFLRELELDLTVDEKRYIENIDYSNKEEVETTLAFFSSKIKSIALYFADKRDRIKFQTVKNNIKGTKTGLHKEVYNKVLELIFDIGYTIDNEISEEDKNDIIRELHISIEELYDIDSGYFEDGTPSHLDDDVSNTIVKKLEYDPYLFIDYDTAQENLLNSYGLTLVSDGDLDILTGNEQVLSPVFDIPLDNISLLPEHEFILYDKQTLNLENIKELIKNTTSAKTMYLSSGDSGASYVTDVLFDSSDNLANMLNKKFPNLNVLPSSEAKTLQELGGLFKPSGLGMLNYYSYSPRPNILTQHIKPNTLYVYPDPEQYSSNTLDIPLDYDEDASNVKDNSLEGNIVGEISGISHMPKFYNYQSDIQTNIYSQFGISRNDDNFDFWSGDNKDIWGNADIYPLDVENIYTLDEKQDDLLVNKGHTYKWRTDSYGNEYAIIKKIHPFEALTEEDFSDPESFTRCTILDGSVFKDVGQNPPDYGDAVINDDENHNLFDYNNFDYVVLRNGESFLYLSCDFPGIFAEQSNQRRARTTEGLQGNKKYCTTLDGYIFMYDGHPFPYDSYKFFSKNVQDEYFYNKDTLFKDYDEWDGGGFDMECVPVPRDELFYKVEDIVLYDNEIYEYNTTELELPDTFTSIPLTEQAETPGELVVRNVTSSSIGSFETAGNRLFERYSTDIQNEISEELLDFDVIENVLLLKTSKSFIIDRVSYDFDKNIISTNNSPGHIPRISDIYDEYIMSEHFYNEKLRHIIVCCVYTNDNSSNIGIDMYTIDVDNFTLSKSSPSVTPLNIHDIKNLSISFNEITYKYYITFLCHSAENFCIGQFICIDLLFNTIDLDIYKTNYTAISTPEQVKKFAHRKITDDYAENGPDDPAGIPITVLFNQPVNTLTLDITDILPGKIVDRIEIDWNVDDDTPLEIIKRSPVVNYEKFDKAIGTDLRDPRSFKIEHVYNTTSPPPGVVGSVSDIDVDGAVITCNIKAYVLGQLANTYVIKIIQHPYDIMTSFESVDICKTVSYSDVYDNENTLVTLCTQTPSYVTSFILRKDSMPREVITYNSNMVAGDELQMESSIDMSGISTTGSTPEEPSSSTISNNASSQNATAPVISPVASPDTSPPVAPPPVSSPGTPPPSAPPSY